MLFLFFQYSTFPLPWVNLFGISWQGDTSGEIMSKHNITSKKALVVWAIDVEIDSTSPKDFALDALATMRDPGESTCFEVHQENGEVYFVDLNLDSVEQHDPSIQFPLSTFNEDGAQIGTEYKKLTASQISDIISHAIQLSVVDRNSDAFNPDDSDKLMAIGELKDALSAAGLYDRNTFGF